PPCAFHQHSHTNGAASAGCAARQCRAPLARFGGDLLLVQAALTAQWTVGGDRRGAQPSRPPAQWAAAAQTITWHVCRLSDCHETGNRTPNLNRLLATLYS